MSGGLGIFETRCVTAVDLIWTDLSLHSLSYVSLVIDSFLVSLINPLNMHWLRNHSHSQGPELEALLVHVGLMLGSPPGSLISRNL